MLGLFCYQGLGTYKPTPDMPGWATGETEDTYNFSYLNENSTLVLHKITPKNIEPCDILKWDSENLYLCHVKAGFNNKMREVCSQIQISASIIKEAVSSKGEYLKEIYKLLKKKIDNDDVLINSQGNQTLKISENDFVKLFKSKNLIFVMAICDTNPKNRDLKNIKQFRSNIAKISLQRLNRDLMGLNVGFRVTQIQNKN